MEKQWTSQSTLVSSILIPSNTVDFRFSVFNQIHEIVFHGGGGYDYMTVYNMPIWLRKFTFHKLKTYHEEQNKTPEQDNTAIGTDGVVKDPSLFKNPQDKQSTKLIKPGPQSRKPISYK